MKVSAGGAAARGPLQRVCSSDTCGVPRSRVPARRPGNFHLRPQMKVTKAKGLNATPLSSFCTRRTRAQRATWKPRRLSYPCFARRVLASHWPWVQRNTGTTQPRIKVALGQRGRGIARSAPPSALSPGAAAGPPSGPLGAVPTWAERKYRFCVQGLCFGDFHLALQMKVTRPPGRDPAGWHATSANKANPLQRPPCQQRELERVVAHGPRESLT